MEQTNDPAVLWHREALATNSPSVKLETLSPRTVAEAIDMMTAALNHAEVIALATGVCAASGDPNTNAARIAHIKMAWLGAGSPLLGKANADDVAAQIIQGITVRAKAIYDGKVGAMRDKVAADAADALDEEKRLQDEADARVAADADPQTDQPAQ